jgi:hypothetical protein
MRKASGVEVTATAPRIRQIEQVHRRAEAKPSVSVTVNRTAPQWQAPLRATGSEEAVSIIVLHLVMPDLMQHPLFFSRKLEEGRSRLKAE